jgi:hypothetical protein
MTMSNLVGCKSTANASNTLGKATTGDISKVPDNLKLISQTKVDEDDILYVYLDQSYHTEIYICKNIKTNTISISASK